MIARQQAKRALHKIRTGSDSDRPKTQLERSLFSASAKQSDPLPSISARDPVESPAGRIAPGSDFVLQRQCLHSNVDPVLTSTHYIVTHVPRFKNCPSPGLPLYSQLSLP